MPRTAVVVILLAVLAAAAPAAADHRPAYVLPHRSGAPIVIDGIEASGAFVEGDWGLYRPGAGRVTVVPGMGPPVPAVGRYFPATGREPGYGRHEAEPPPGTPRPRPAQPYRRNWGTNGGGPGHSDVVAPFYAEEPPHHPPPVIEAHPQVRIGPRQRMRPRHRN